MREWLLQWLIGSIALLGTAYFIPGFKIKSFRYALIAALVIGFVGTLVRPILLFLTLPLNILTLGLFTFVVNAAVLKICAALTPGFDIQGWWSAIFGAIVLAVLNYAAGWLIFG